MATSRETFKVSVDVDVKRVLKVLNTMGKEANTELRSEVINISQGLAQAIVAAAGQAPFTMQAQRVASTVRANRDRVPSITVGGSRGKLSGGATAGTVVYGNEFGANDGQFFPNGGRRFPERSPKKGRGNTGYWIFPTLTAMQPQLVRDWKEAVGKIFEKWGRD
jgi:hypothetical protein